MVEPRQLHPEDIANYARMYVRATSKSGVGGQSITVVDGVVVDLVPHIEWLNAELASADAELRREVETVAAKTATIKALQATITDLQQRLAAATDDPAADLPGTVRISPDGVAYIRNDDEGVVYVWHSPCPGARPHWMTDKDVTGWTRGTPVEGTPAAKAAHTETPTMCGAWHREQQGAPAVCPLPAGHADVNWPNPDRP